jgi:hypothetical protein
MMIIRTLWCLRMTVIIKMSGLEGEFRVSPRRGN